jgi:protein tyrosine phosphatase (PTP) superfamily phosphohydrolase (DUF442 family)
MTVLSGGAAFIRRSGKIEKRRGLMLSREGRALRVARRVESWESGLTSQWARAQAWLDLLVIDHGFLRLFYRNRHRVSAQVWRSAQPTPGDLKRFKKRGLKSVICVRGGRAFGAWPLEREACERLQIHLRKVSIRAREAPRKEDLLGLIDQFESVEYPILIHCKSGADRTGFATAVYLMSVEGRSPDEALAQLALRYGHLRFSRAGILREVIESFRQDASALHFRAWVETRYDATEITRRSQSGLRILAFRR